MNEQYFKSGERVVEAKQGEVSESLNLDLSSPQTYLKDFEIGKSNEDLQQEYLELQLKLNQLKMDTMRKSHQVSPSRHKSIDFQSPRKRPSKRSNEGGD